MKTQTITIAGLIALFISLAVAFLWYSTTTFGAEFPQASNSPKQYASNTATTLTWGATATRVVSTSTRNAAGGGIDVATAGRSGITFQARNCGATAGAGGIWLNFNDVAAATNTGYFLGASTTLTFSDDVPIVNGSVTAAATHGTCVLHTTEWRTEN